MNEAPTEFYEHAEHAEHVAQSGDPFLTRISITIAVLAVLAATVGSLETIETAHTIREKTTAAIVQNQATDTWAIFARHSLKRTMYEIAGDGVADARRDAYAAKVRNYSQQADATQKKAEELEAEVAAANADSARHEHRHMVLTIAATFLHIAIAVATIAIVMRARRWPFRVAVALGILGTIGGLLAYV